MTDQAEKFARFKQLHEGPQPFLLANAWDAGSARLLQSLGCQAIATTSSGHAASLGRLDYAVSRAEAVEHARAIVAATDLPVSADFEHCFAPDAAGVAETIGLAVEAGLAGCSIEDYSPEQDALYDFDTAVERVAAATAAAHSGSGGQLFITARAENYLRGKPDLADTIARLQAFEQAGADALYAPALDDPDELRELLAAVSLPVNVLVRPATPTIPELGALGVRRVSVGGSFAFAAYGAAARAASELLEHGTLESLELAAHGGRTARAAFAPSHAADVPEKHDSRVK